MLKDWTAFTKNSTKTVNKLTDTCHKVKAPEFRCKCEKVQWKVERTDPKREIKFQYNTSIQK